MRLKAAIAMTAALTAAATLSWTARAVADPVADFYKGKNIQLVVGYGPGGGYDIYARLIARFIGDRIAFSPPLIITEAEIDEIMIRLRRALDAAAKELNV